MKDESRGTKIHTKFCPGCDGKHSRADTMLWSVCSMVMGSKLMTAEWKSIIEVQ